MMNAATIVIRRNRMNRDIQIMAMLSDAVEDCSSDTRSGDELMNIVLVTVVVLVVNDVSMLVFVVVVVEVETLVKLIAL